MKSPRVLQRLVGAGAAAAAAAALLTGAVAVPAQADVPQATVLAVTGTNNALYARVAGQPGWTNFGGALASAPAVASWGGIVHFVGTGTNKVLYHRAGFITERGVVPMTAWRKLSTAYCTDVSATADSEKVYLSCRGGNGALYAGQFAVSSQTPSIPALTRLGGLVQGAVPVTLTDAGPTYIGRGGAYSQDGYTGNTWQWDAQTGWTRYWAWCDGTPALTSSSTVLFFACQSGQGVIAGEAWHPVDGDTYDWSFFDVAGQAIGTPALAMLDQERAELFVQGADKVVYHRTLGVDGATGSRWSKISSAVIGGVAATTLWTDAPE